MSDYLLQRFKPFSDELGRAHHLHFDDDIRTRLARLMMHSRMVLASGQDKKGAHSPMPSLRIALTHADALARFETHPPFRRGSIPLRCKKLAQSLRANDLVGFELILAAPPFDPTNLLSELDAGIASPGELKKLRETLHALDVNQKAWKIGRPTNHLTEIVFTGCHAWLASGHQLQTASRWKESEDKLIGPLANFLRDLIAYCKGTQKSISELEKQVGSLRVPARKGDRLRASDLAIRDAIRKYLTDLHDSASKK